MIDTPRPKVRLTAGLSEKRRLKKAEREALEAERRSSVLTVEALDAEEKATDLQSKATAAADRVRELEEALERAAQKALRMRQEADARIATAEAEIPRVEKLVAAQIAAAAERVLEVRRRVELAEEAVTRRTRELDVAKGRLAVAVDAHATAQADAELASTAAELAKTRAEEAIAAVRAAVEEERAKAEQVVTAADEGIRVARIAHEGAQTEHENITRQITYADNDAGDRRALAGVAQADADRVRTDAETTRTVAVERRAEPKQVSPRLLGVLLVVVIVAAAVILIPKLTKSSSAGGSTATLGMHEARSASGAPEVLITVLSDNNSSASYRLELIAGYGKPTTVAAHLAPAFGDPKVLAVPLNGLKRSNVPITAQLYRSGSSTVYQQVTIRVSPAGHKR